MRQIQASIVVLAGLLGCSAGRTGTGDRPDDAGSAAGGASGAGSQPHLGPLGGAGGGAGAGGALMVAVGGAGGGASVKDPNDPRDVPVRQKRCDASGTVCTCLRLALLGTLESAAFNADTQPFVDWLNGNSEGKATVTMVATKPSLDAAFLASYDILLVANVNGWHFSADEKASVEAWVKQQGGGIISLTGFVSTETEPADTSQLISFAGLGYSPARTSENGRDEPVYYQGGAVDLKQCLAWSGSSDALITTPIPFTPQGGSLEKLTQSLSYVGAFIGFGVTAPPGATVLATDPASGQSMAVAYEVEGKGRIFAFGDEWVIFKNQWEPIGDPTDTTMTASNQCWQPGAGASAGFFQSVKTLYQTKQFWFNAINWVAPPNECNFTLKDPDVVVVK
jgi:hypothetical protein